MHWARLEASALGSLIAAYTAWKRREKRDWQNHIIIARLSWSYKQRYATVVPCLTARIATCLLPGFCSKYPITLATACARGMLTDVTFHWEIRRKTGGRAFNESKTRKLSVHEIGERHRLNRAIVGQAACQAVICRMMCLQAACKLLANIRWRHSQWRR